MKTCTAPLPSPLLPLAAAMFAGTLGLVSDAALAQESQDKTLKTVTVHDQAATDMAAGKENLRAGETRIGKAQQDVRDIPQSLTVVTERLLDERNLDTLKEALKNTAGISFLAAEGGEEDIRLRGFSLQAAGDVYIDGVRDPAFYERDTFNLDRLEVLRGSASLLFGRGSTGGAVNQVNKPPRLMDENQAQVTLGSHNYKRVVSDFNKRLDESSALRLTLMKTQADNNGAGARIDKAAVAGAYRYGIGEKNELQLDVYYLKNKNGINYGLPWIRPTTNSPASDVRILPLAPQTNFGAASDRSHGSARYATFTYTHHFAPGSEWRTVVRKGRYERDQRSGAIRFGDATLQGGEAVSLATFGPQTVLTRGKPQLKIQDLNTWHAQSDFSKKFELWGMQHELLAGVDWAAEDKTVYAARNAAQGGVDLVKATTRIGSPQDGFWVNEDSRVLRVNNRYKSSSLGAYVQNMVQLAPAWKVLGGLRYDRVSGDFDQFAAPADASQANGAKTQYRMQVGAWSKRLGILFQPSSQQSYHLSYGSSFNTSGDTYSLNAANANTPPEQSLNLELGAKFDSADKQWSTRVALFQTTKKRERNTDPLLPVNVLSGSRYVRGIELDIAGRLTPRWEVFGSLAWMPQAKVTKAAPCPEKGSCAQGTPGERLGDRPALIPRYSAALWTTYQIHSQWRLGAGLNLRGKDKPTRSEFHVPAFVVGDVMAEYVVNPSLAFKLNVSNVANKRYADQLYRGHYIPGAGRLVQLSASIQF